VTQYLTRACADGTASACGRLATQLQAGIGSPPDLAEAGRAMRAACEAGAEQACAACAGSPVCELDLAKLEGLGVRRALVDIADGWDPACDTRLGPACGWRTVAADAEVDWERSDVYHLRACDARQRWSCARVASDYAMDLAEQSCGAGSLADCLFAAEARAVDARHTGNVGPAIVLYEMACELEHPTSCARAGWWYLDDAGGGGDPGHAIDLLRKACGLESEVACRKLEQLNAAP
jgi:TPR repeat protein